MRILLSTNHLFRWAGSEVVLLEIAEEFCRQGHRVTVFANEISGPFEKILRDSGIAFTHHFDQLDVLTFDIIYVQHHTFPLLLRGAASQGTHQNRQHFPVLIYNHLSPYDPFEAPGPFIEERLGDIKMCNSPETASSLRRFGSAFQEVRVMPNPAPQSFASADTTDREKLSKLLVVSNHIPKELLEALKQVRRAGVDVETIGRQSRSQRVTPDMISRCDAVVTIGKTTQYALRSRKAVFCYDRFAGPGWLQDIETFQNAGNYNFSGRSTLGQRSAEELKDEILDGFSSARKFVVGLDDEDLAPFKLETHVNQLIIQSRDMLNDRPRNEAKFQLLADRAFLGEINREASMAEVIRGQFQTRRKLELAKAHRSWRSRLRRVVE